MGASCASACTRSGDEGPRERTQLFYDAIAGGRFDEARVSVLDGAGLRGLERRFGSFASWASRATKNETLMRSEVLAEDVEANRARIEVVLLFNDGTRRHDNVELARAGGGWKLDPRSLPGAGHPNARDAANLRAR